MSKLGEKEETCKAAIDYMAQLNISQNDLAIQCGISSASISFLINRVFDKVSPEMCRLVWKVVKPANHNLKLIETGNLNTIQDVSSKTRERHFLTAVLGDTGLGKQHPLRCTQGARILILSILIKRWLQKTSLYRFSKKMGVGFEGSINQMVNRIADELNVQEDPLIIIDECGKLNNTMILYLHVLRDKTCDNCGIILSGMPYFKSKLIKDAAKNKEGMSEFFSRINLWIELKKPSKREVESICELNGIYDPEIINEMMKHKDFRSLNNAIIFHNLLLEV